LQRDGRQSKILDWGLYKSFLYKSIEGEKKIRHLFYDLKLLKVDFCFAMLTKASYKTAKTL
jgi:hypothetical protein